VTSHYGGRLGEELAAIVGKHEGAGSGLESRAHNLSQELLSRAIGFEKANQAGVGALAAEFASVANLPANSPLIRWLIQLFGGNLTKAAFIWAGSGLAAGGLASLIAIVDPNPLVLRSAASVLGASAKHLDSTRALSATPDHPRPASPEKLLRTLDDVLKPIDWAEKYAPKQFKETLVAIGRFMNAVNGQRGSIQVMTQLGDALGGTAKAVGAVTDLLFVRDTADYVAGRLTNQQFAPSVIKKLLPIPILNERVADWIASNMPDPTGRWRGLVSTVQ
jgi:hypothetical protein